MTWLQDYWGNWKVSMVTECCNACNQGRAVRDCGVVKAGLGIWHVCMVSWGMPGKGWDGLWCV